MGYSSGRPHWVTAHTIQTQQKPLWWSDILCPGRTDYFLWNRRKLRTNICLMRSLLKYCTSHLPSNSTAVVFCFTMSSRKFAFKLQKLKKAGGQLRPVAWWEPFCRVGVSPHSIYHNLYASHRWGVGWDTSETPAESDQGFPAKWAL